MRFTKLSGVGRPETRETALAALPERIRMAEYAMKKAFRIDELVRTVHKGSFEWYGYTIADRAEPALIRDIGLPRNARNVPDYTSVHAEGIAEYRESLPRGAIINGWIHSHGSLDFRGFSSTDERNQATVLEYVTALLRKPVAKREVVIEDLVLLVKGRFDEKELAEGSVTLVTDVPVGEASILETVYGGFCYSIVIGEGGWHRQEIRYKRRGILTGRTAVSRNDAEVVFVDTGRTLTQEDLDALDRDVREKIQPEPRVPRDRYEKEAT